MAVARLYRSFGRAHNDELAITKTTLLKDCDLCPATKIVLTNRVGDSRYVVAFHADFIWSIFLISAAADLRDPLSLTLSILQKWK